MGFLWGKHEVLEAMQPWMGGGEMIQVKRARIVSHHMAGLLLLPF